MCLTFIMLPIASCFLAMANAFIDEGASVLQSAKWTWNWNASDLDATPIRLWRDRNHEVDCPTGYEYSHRGWWSSKEIETVYTAGKGRACSDVCDQQPGCKAISFYLKGAKSCYTYGTSADPNGGFAKIVKNHFERWDGGGGASYACVKFTWPRQKLRDPCPLGYDYSHAGYWNPKPANPEYKWGKKVGSVASSIDCAKACEKTSWCSAISYFTWGDRMCFIYMHEQTYPWTEVVTGDGIACQRNNCQSKDCNDLYVDEIPLGHAKVDQR